jgi:hypothetical protein
MNYQPSGLLAWENEKSLAHLDRLDGSLKAPTMTRYEAQFPDFNFLGVPMCDLEDPVPGAQVVTLGAPSMAGELVAAEGPADRCAGGCLRGEDLDREGLGVGRPCLVLDLDVNVNVPAVLGTPLISRVLPAKSNSFVPVGRRPSTTLNDGMLRDDEQPVTVMKTVYSVPTWPVGGVWGRIVHVAACADGAPSIRIGRIGARRATCAWKTRLGDVLDVSSPHSSASACPGKRSRERW